jgi:Ca2+-binding RTX toxin-like protein
VELRLLTGGDGADTIVGYSSNDTIQGKRGADLLNGGAGSDVYVYASGDGADKIDESSGSTADVDRLRFVDLNEADVTLSKVGNDLMVRINSTGETIEIDEHFYSTTANWGIETIQFANGTTWNLARINHVATGSAAIIGTASGETLNGTSAAETLFGEGGNDVINGDAGNDIIGGGNNNDTLNGGAGSDTLYGDSGNDTFRLWTSVAGEIDTLHGGDGVDGLDLSAFGFAVWVDLVAANDSGKHIWTKDGPTIVSGTWRHIGFAHTIENVTGSAYADELYGSTLANALTGGAGDDRLEGREGNDILNGGLGADILIGGSGNDAFVFASGFGVDVVHDFAAGAGIADVLRLSLGTAFDTYTEIMAVTAQNGADSVITISPGNTITLKNITKTALVADDFVFV